MQGELLEALKLRIDQRYYTISDILTCEFEFSGLVNIEAEASDIISGGVLDNIADILFVGELPQLNPDFSHYSHEQKLDRKKLVEYIKENSYYVVSNVDVNSNHVTALVDLKLLFLNFMKMQDNDLNKINHVKVNSFMGEAEIGETKKEL